MCSIFGSFNTDKLKELAQLNLYRGQHSYSFSYYDPTTKQITYMQRALGEFPFDDIDIPEGQYAIAHMQAPTTSNKRANTIHPAIIGKHFLWHNGIVKDHCVKEMSRNTVFIENGDLDYLSWDTYLILHQYVYEGNINRIDGTFSCVHYCDGEGLKLFRNEISPMFIDDDYNISSTKFNNSTSLKPNIIWKFIPGEGIISIDTFKTVENPYFFMDEVT